MVSAKLALSVSVRSSTHWPSWKDDESVEVPPPPPTPKTPMLNPLSPPESLWPNDLASYWPPAEAEMVDVNAGALDRMSVSIQPSITSPYPVMV